MIRKADGVSPGPAATRWRTLRAPENFEIAGTPRARPRRTFDRHRPITHHRFSYHHFTHAFASARVASTQRA